MAQEMDNILQRKEKIVLLVSGIVIPKSITHLILFRMQSIPFPTSPMSCSYR